MFNMPEKYGRNVALVSKGIETLVRQCQVVARHDNILQHPNVKIFLHATCRRALAYKARKCTTEGNKAPVTSQRFTRCVTVVFCFKEMCFLCSERVAGNSDVRKVLSGGDFVKRFKDVIWERGYDEWALAV